MVKKRKHSEEQPTYVESSLGIITTSGHWFHITRDQIEQMAPGIYDLCRLEELVKAAEIWIKSTDSLSLLLYFVLVMVIPPTYAVLVVLAFFTLWYTQKSALVSPHLTTLLKWINADATLIISAGVFLSWLGMTGQYMALAMGILFFFLFKLGLLRWGFDWVHRQLKTGMTLNDRLFKMVVIKYAIAHGVEVPEIEDMNQKIQQLMKKRQGKK